MRYPTFSARSTERRDFRRTEAAHAHVRDGQPWPIRVILDVVVNHSGDNWSYPGDNPYFYSNDQRFDFGGWRRPDRPRPV